MTALNRDKMISLNSNLNDIQIGTSNHYRLVLLSIAAFLTIQLSSGGCFVLSEHSFSSRNLIQLPSGFPSKNVGP